MRNLSKKEGSKKRKRERKIGGKEKRKEGREGGGKGKEERGRKRGRKRTYGGEFLVNLSSLESPGKRECQLRILQIRFSLKVVSMVS